MSKIESGIQTIKNNYLDARRSYEAALAEGDLTKYNYHSARAEAFALALGALGQQMPKVN